MIIRLFLFLTLLFSVLTSQAQTEFGVFAGNTTLGKESFVQGGIQWYVPLGDSRWTLNYTFSVGKSNTNAWYIHCPASIIGAGLVAFNSYLDKASLETALVLLLIPEGVGVYLDDKRNTHLSFNVLAIDYKFRRDPYDEFVNLGLNTTLNTRFKTVYGFPSYVSPFIGVSYYYYAPSQIRTSVNFGLSFEINPKDPNGSTHNVYDPLFN